MKKSDVPRISSLGYALLSLLARRDRSGYELSRSTSAPRDSLLWSAGHSQIYPELGKLADAGYVSFAAVAQARRPDKKVYRLSEEGARALKAWVRLPPKPAPDRRELSVKAHAAWLIEPAEAATLFRDQAARTEAEIAEIEAHRDMLEAGTDGPFPPPVEDPLFGTYANMRFALESRRQLADWCLWVAGELAAAGTLTGADERTVAGQVGRKRA